MNCSNNAIPDEIAIWKELEHPGIVTLRDAYYHTDSKDFFLVMDYDPDFVDLFDYVATHGVLDNKSAATVIMQVLIFMFII